MWGRIRIKVRKAYFHGKHMDFVWSSRKGIKIRIKGDCGSFPWYIRKIDFRLDVVKKVLLGKNYVCDIEKRGGEYGGKLYFHIYNGKWFHGSLLVYGST
jgi:hypothetical protein